MHVISLLFRIRKLHALHQFKKQINLIATDDQPIIKSPSGQNRLHALIERIF